MPAKKTTKHSSKKQTALQEYWEARLADLRKRLRDSGLKEVDTDPESATTQYKVTFPRASGPKKSPNARDSHIQALTPLDRLRAMPLEGRIEAVVEDIQTGRDEFADIDSHDLAHVLGVPSPDKPDDHWAFTTYAERVSLEEYGQDRGLASEVCFFLEGKVSPERYETLLDESFLLDDEDNPDFGFLTTKERKFIEDAIAQEALKRNQGNGMNCIAHYSVDGLEATLCFEAVVEDDGTCIYMRTPYDEREGNFVDLRNCVTDSW